MNCRRAFTLVELLVVIAIIGILVALLLPAVQAAREAARRMQCTNNLKQVALALLGYHDQQGTFPPSLFYQYPGEDPSKMDNFRPNWVIMMLPFFEQQSLHDAFNLSLPISHADNRWARGTPIPSFVCPSDTGHDVKFAGTTTGEGDNWARGNYAANAGNGPLLPKSWNYSSALWGKDSPGWQDSRRRGVMGPNVGVKIAEITDGTSNTILAGEIRVGLSELDRRGTWAMGTASASILFWYGSTGDANGPNACYEFADDVEGCARLDHDLLLKECMDCSSGSYQATTRSQHQDGVLVAFVDGSVHFISNYIETSGAYGSWGTVWDFLIASADGEPVSAGKVGL